MRFLILHESPGRLRLRAELRQMTLRQADLLDAWLREQAGVEQVTVHERTCGVTVLYRGDRAALCASLAGFSWENAEKCLSPEEHSSRAMNREYKEKLVMLVVRHYARRLLLPAPLRRALWRLPWRRCASGCANTPERAPTIAPPFFPTSAEHATHRRHPLGT